MKHKPRSCRCKQAWAYAVFRGLLCRTAETVSAGYLALPVCRRYMALSGYGRRVSGMV
ncbi:MAG: hypothetical protein GX795_10850 [Firmicutes bacterium]|nr:hypothetical protein [Bacillota bacterium]